MAKSDRSLEQVDLTGAYQNQFSATWANDCLVNAFDTETTDGTVFMLTYAHGDTVESIYNEDVEQVDNAEIMRLLTHHLTRSNLNVWYNLDFDANAILSGILSKREMTKLVVTNNTTTTVAGMEYRITYVKGKFLEIRDKNDNISRHYDISQFFYMSLNDAAEEWLGKGKVEDIDTSRFDEKDYVKDNFDDILHYAEVDAIITQKLAIELIREAEDLDIPMGKPISTGYLSAEYLRGNTESKPGVGNREMQGMFWDSYYGGRFEVFKRGNVGEVAAPDINSAYPAIMKDLPDPKTLDWEHYTNEGDMHVYSFTDNKFDFADLQAGDYGVVRANVTTDKYRRIQPFACKIDGKVKFPVMKDKEVTVIKPIFEFAVENNIVTDYELKEAWVGDVTEDTEYPFSFIGPMYAQRKVFENLDNKPKKGELLKIVLNSSYGKTCQTTEKRRIHDLAVSGEYNMEFNETQYNKMHLSKEQRKALTDDEVIITSLDAGKRFNPFFASYITGMTRLELHKQVVDHNLEENTVMFATDCLMIEKEAYENSSFDEQIVVPDESLPESEYREKAIESLGAWDYDYRGDAFVVGSGVYEVLRANGKVKTKTRGFLEKDLDGTLRELAEAHPEAIPIDNERPLTMAEVLINSKRGSVSEFIESSKELQPDFDDKRVWQRDNPDFHDLLEAPENSMPIDLGKIRKEQLDEAARELSVDEITAQLTNETIETHI